MRSIRLTGAVLMGLALIASSLATNAQGAWKLADVRDFEVDDGRMLGLSPDGTLYAVANPWRNLCVYDTATLAEVSCGSTEALSNGVRLEDAVWSPDSTRIAFSERGFDYGDDSDLWVMEAATGIVTNLTDDGFAGTLAVPAASPTATDVLVDVAPAWTPDSQFITFARSEWIGAAGAGTAIVQIPARGGLVTPLVQLSETEPFLISHKTQWSPDGTTFYYSLTHGEYGHPDNGIWAFDMPRWERRPVAIDGDPQLGPLALLEVAPSGDRLLAWYPEAYNGFEIDQFLPQLVDLETGELVPIAPPDAFAEEHPGGFTVPTFAPDGTMLLGVTSFGEDPGAVWVTDLTTGEQTMLIDGLDGVTVEVGRTPSWGANDTIMTARGTEAGYLLTLSPGIDGTPTAAVGASVAGPVQGFEVEDGWVNALSPDGTLFVVAEERAICIYSVETLWYLALLTFSELPTSILRFVDPVSGVISELDFPDPVANPEYGFGHFSPDGQAYLKGATIEPGVQPAWGTNGTILFGHGEAAGYLTTVTEIGMSQSAARSSGAGGLSTK